MQWLLDHLQIVALIVLGLITLLKSRLDAKMAGEKGKPGDLEPADDEPWPERPPPLPQVTPPALRPRQKTPNAFQAPAEQAAILKRQQELQAQLQQLKDPRKAMATTTGGAVVTRARALAAQRGNKPVAAAKSELKASLRRRSEVQRAVVLREILGPPLGLR